MTIYPVNTIKSFIVISDTGGLLRTPVTLETGSKISMTGRSGSFDYSFSFTRKVRQGRKKEDGTSVNDNKPGDSFRTHILYKQKAITQKKLSHRATSHNTANHEIFKTSCRQSCTAC